MKTVGRQNELEHVSACLRAKKNVLIEGPVGVGKTHLALAATEAFKLPVYRIDGDSRYSEQKLSGWFDPPTVLKKGFCEESFIAGPLVEAMRSGGVVFINELNRLPEGVQNVLLPAIDERVISVPKLGAIKAVENFIVIATQNPKEFVATSHLSEAILDRFELIVLDYQNEEEEAKIVSLSKNISYTEKRLDICETAVRLARLTRQHQAVRRGASVRAAISVAELAAAFMQTGHSFENAILSAAILALPTRIELEHTVENVETDAHKSIRSLIEEWVDAALKKKG
ncbi:MAG: MoxR family ATPase [Candidatus Poribacteria bacterium]